MSPRLAVPSIPRQEKPVAVVYLMPVTFLHEPLAHEYALVLLQEVAWEIFPRLRPPQVESYYDFHGWHAFYPLLGKNSHGYPWFRTYTAEDGGEYRVGVTIPSRGILLEGYRDNITVAEVADLLRMVLPQRLEVLEAEKKATRRLSL